MPFGGWIIMISLDLVAIAAVSFCLYSLYKYCEAKTLSSAERAINKNNIVHYDEFPNVQHSNSLEHESHDEDEDTESNGHNKSNANDYSI